MTESKLKYQVGRLHSLPVSGNQDWEVLKVELLNTLWTISSDDDHARAIIDRAIESKPADGKPQFCPTPAALREFADAIANDRKAEYSVGATKCDACSDTGWRQVKRIVGGREYEFAERCKHS